MSGMTWHRIDDPEHPAPRDKPLLLAGRWDGLGQSGDWDIQIGQWLTSRFMFVGNNGPTHWSLPSPPKD